MWVDWVADVRGHAIPTTWAGIAEYLRAATNWIAAHPDGPQCVDELTAAIRQARRAIDRPAERRYVGVCTGADVDVDVDVLADRDTAECPKCGTVWQVHVRQDAILEQLRDHVLTAADIARAVDGLGIDITFDRIRQWKRRGLLSPVVDDVGHPRADVHGRPLYRVGDVLDFVSGKAAAV